MHQVLDSHVGYRNRDRREWFDAFQRQGVGERKVAKTGVTDTDENTVDRISRQSRGQARAKYKNL